MKLKLIMMSAFIALSQSQAATKPPLPLGDSGDTNVMRAVSAGAFKPASGTDDAASTGGGGAASVAPSVRTTGTVGTVSADRMQAVMQKCRELAAANAAQHERLTALESVTVALTTTLMPRDKETLLEAAGRQRTVLDKLEGIFSLKEGDKDLAAAARRVMAEERAALEARHVTALASATATHEAKIERLRAEFKAEMEAKDRAHAEALGLLEGKVAAATAAVATEEEEVKKSGARVVELEKAIRLASAAIARRELDLANQIKSAFTQQGIAEERARYYLVLATTFHGKLSSWSRPRFEEYKDTDALEIVSKTYGEDYAKITSAIHRAAKALADASRLEVDAILRLLREEEDKVARGEAPSTLMVDMPGSAKKAGGGGSHRKLSRASDPGFPSGRPPLVPTRATAAMAEILAAAPAVAGAGGKRG